jgi:acetyl-CoA carboxylase biotin carboxyl carrier protein
MARRRAAGSGKGTRHSPPSLTEIVELVTRHGLAELEVESGGTRIRVVREHAPAAAPSRLELSQGAHVSGQVAPVEEAVAGANLVTIEAPMVGTFYRAAAPDATPFISEGDHIKEGQVLCIIEAMKLMNEIEAKVGGRITKILVENGQPVEYGQPLFLMEPRR